MAMQRQDPAGRSEARRRLKELALRILDAGEEDAILVNELRCSEPGCPPLETVIALLRERGERREVKIHKPIEDITEEDLRSAFAQVAHAHDPDTSSEIQ
jgi:hypothetical protein